MRSRDLIERLRQLDPRLHSTILATKDAASEKLKRVVEVFPHYTSHDISHSIRVIEICSWLMSEELYLSLGAAELFVLIGSAFLHDVGMTLEPAEREQVLADEGYIKFERTSGLNRTEALAEWIRRAHHLRSAAIVRTTGSDPSGIGINDRTLANAIALVCESHGESDLEDFAKYDPFYAWGTAGQHICLPLLGVLLRLGDLLHLTADRTPLSVLPLVRLENAKSKAEWAKHLQTGGIAPIPSGAARLTCLCNDPQVHRDLLRLCDYVNREFGYCGRLLQSLKSCGCPEPQLTCTRVEPNIQANGYVPWVDLTFSLDRDGILQLLAGERLYRGPGAVVRELLMNAVDATRQQGQLSGLFAPVSVELDTLRGTLTVSDNGTGMNEGDLRDFLLRLGRSIYRSEEYRSRYAEGQRIDSLSEFGIGFASAFFVSQHVTLDTNVAGGEPIHLDMFDLLGFAAARRGARRERGTKVTLHLKRALIDEIKSSVQAIDELCPHVGVPLLVTIDGKLWEVRSQPFVVSAEELLAPYFRGRYPEFLVETHDFSISTPDIRGTLSVICELKDGVVIPGGPAWWKLARRPDRRRVSQLGFQIPTPDRWPDSLLGILNLGVIRYDLDLCGTKRLELDASRNSVLGTESNRRIIEEIDAQIADFIYRLHNTYWRDLSREKRFAAYDALGKMLFTRVSDPMRAGRSTASERLLDLLLENMPLCTINHRGETEKLTWNEIRQTARPVLFFQSFKWLEGPHSSRVVSAECPEAIIVLEDPSHWFGTRFLDLARMQAVHVSDQLKTAFQIVRPLSGNAREITAARMAAVVAGQWSFLVPFTANSAYAVISSRAQRRSCAVEGWINSAHPKIAAMLAAGARLNSVGLQTPKTVEFFQFLHREHLGSSGESEYVSFVRSHQQAAIDELVANSGMDRQAAELNFLDGHDFAVWELE